MDYIVNTETYLLGIVLPYIEDYIDFINYSLVTRECYNMSYDSTTWTGLLHYKDLILNRSDIVYYTKQRYNSTILALMRRDTVIDTKLIYNNLHLCPDDDTFDYALTLLKNTDVSGGFKIANIYAENPLPLYEIFKNRYRITNLVKSDIFCNAILVKMAIRSNNKELALDLINNEFNTCYGSLGSIIDPFYYNDISLDYLTIDIISIVDMSYISKHEDMVCNELEHKICSTIYLDILKKVYPRIHNKCAKHDVILSICTTPLDGTDRIEWIVENYGLKFTYCHAIIAYTNHNWRVGDYILDRFSEEDLRKCIINRKKINRLCYELYHNYHISDEDKVISVRKLAILYKKLFPSCTTIPIYGYIPDIAYFELIRILRCYIPPYMSKLSPEMYAGIRKAVCDEYDTSLREKHVQYYANKYLNYKL